MAKEFLEAVESNVLSQRPSWRINDAKSNAQCESALLLSDVSVFPRSKNQLLLGLTLSKDVPFNCFESEICGGPREYSFSHLIYHLSDNLCSKKIQVRSIEYLVDVDFCT